MQKIKTKNRSKTNLRSEFKPKPPLTERKLYSLQKDLLRMSGEQADQFQVVGISNLLCQNERGIKYMLIQNFLHQPTFILGKINDKELILRWNTEKKCFRYSLS